MQKPAQGVGSVQVLLYLFVAAAVAVFAAACRAADAFLAALFGFDDIGDGNANNQDDHPNGDPSFNSHSFFSLLTAEGVFLA